MSAAITPPEEFLAHPKPTVRSVLQEFDAWTQDRQEIYDREERGQYVDNDELFNSDDAGLELLRMAIEVLTSIKDSTK